MSRLAGGAHCSPCPAGGPSSSYFFSGKHRRQASRAALLDCGAAPPCAVQQRLRIESRHVEDSVTCSCKLSGVKLVSLPTSGASRRRGGRGGRPFPPAPRADGGDGAGGEGGEFDAEGQLELDVDTEAAEPLDTRDLEVTYEFAEGQYEVREGEGEGGEEEGGAAGQGGWAAAASEGDWEEHVLDRRILEQEFHKVPLHACDFFVRKVPDPDGDVYDLSEIYVSDPDTDVYSIPRIRGRKRFSKKPIRCTQGEWKILVTKLGDEHGPRAQWAVSADEVAKVFLIKHLQNRRSEAMNFVLDFEEVYVFDGDERSVHRADVEVAVPLENRNRNHELLVVGDDGKSFKIIKQTERRTPDEIVAESEWAETKEALDTYLRGFRDYERSNWF